MKKDTPHKEVHNLRLEILPCRELFHSELQPQYEEAYKLWQKVWSKTLLKLDGVKRLHSNEFTRHDFCTVIFKNEKAISLICYSQINPGLITRMNDSWFAAWPKEILYEIGKSYNYCVMPAWLAVDPDFRRSRTNYPLNLGQIIMEVYAQVILEYNFQLGFGTTRNERGVDKLIKRTGGYKLGSSKDHGVDVDLICMYPDKIKDYQKGFSAEFKYLWSNRKDHWRVKNDKQGKVFTTNAHGGARNLGSTLA